VTSVFITTFNTDEVKLTQLPSVIVNDCIFWQLGDARHFTKLPFVMEGVGDDLQIDSS
jgi:hypothetical protein